MTTTAQKIAQNSKASAEIRRCASCQRGAAVIFPDWALAPGGPGGHCRYCQAPATDEQTAEMSMRISRARHKRLIMRGAQ